MTDRDEQGRFLPGHDGLPGAGRPRGSRQSLSDQFIADLSEFWEREGPSILAQVAAERPGELVRAVARLVPKQEKPLQEGVVMVLDYTGYKEPEAPE